MSTSTQERERWNTAAQWLIRITAANVRPGEVAPDSWDATCKREPDRELAGEMARGVGGPGATWTIYAPLSAEQIATAKATGAPLLDEAHGREPVETGIVGDRMIGAWAETLAFPDLREHHHSANNSDNGATMSDLCERFHVLDAEIPGVRPWDPVKLDRWLRTGPGCTSATRHAALFVLHVWNQGPWKAGAFDATKAIACWDGRNRAAFLSWAAAPWWP